MEYVNAFQVVDHVPLDLLAIMNAVQIIAYRHQHVNQFQHRIQLLLQHHIVIHHVVIMVVGHQMVGIGKLVEKNLIPLQEWYNQEA